MVAGAAVVRDNRASATLQSAQAVYSATAFEEPAVIHVIATIQLNAGTRGAFLEEFHKLVPLVRAEDGCIEYGPTVDEPTALKVQELAGEDAVVVVEKWDSVAALEAHTKAPHMNDYRERVANLVRSVQLLILKPV